MPIIVEGQVFEPGSWRERHGTLPPAETFSLNDQHEDRKAFRPKNPPEAEKRINPVTQWGKTPVVVKCQACGARLAKSGRCFACQPENCPTCGRPRHPRNGRCYQCHPPTDNLNKERDPGPCPKCGKPRNSRNGRCYVCTSKPMPEVERRPCAKCGGPVSPKNGRCYTCQPGRQKAQARQGE